MIWTNLITIRTWMIMMTKMILNQNRIIRNKLKKDIILTVPTKIQLLKKIMDLLKYKKIVLKSKKSRKIIPFHNLKLHLIRCKMKIALKMSLKSERARIKNPINRKKTRKKKKIKIRKKKRKKKWILKNKKS